jgi:RNase H-fold protein (predicted Holliday junction resolvase)
MMPQRILAIDPGREKCGLAAMDRQQGVLQQAIVDCPQLLDMVNSIAQRYKCRILVLGNGTAATATKEKLLTLLRERQVEKIELINERNSTQEARLRYWLAHPPSGWRKFIPAGLLAPPCAIDDFAAIILGERYFAKNQ